MKKIILTISIIVSAIIGYWLISPFFIDKTVSENFPKDLIDTSGEMKPHLSGFFNGFDKIHYGSGDVNIYKTSEGYILRFEENFNVANGPDLFVGFGVNGKYVKEAQLERLKGTKGSQNYLIPESFNLELYNEVWIWCRIFSVGFAKAELK